MANRRRRPTRRRFDSQKSTRRPRRERPARGPSEAGDRRQWRIAAGGRRDGASIRKKVQGGRGVSGRRGAPAKLGIDGNGESLPEADATALRFAKKYKEAEA